MENNNLDRFGNCPSCGTNFDGGDIYEVISKLDIHMNKSAADMLKFAEINYGYNSVNKKHFSNLIGVTLAGSENKPLPDFWKCPHCGTIWDAETSKQFKNLNEARNQEDE